MQSVQISEIDSRIRFVSHEIRNHLSVCDMYLQIIKKYLEKDGYKNPSVLNAINCISQSLRIISMNVTDLKSVNKNEPVDIDFKASIEKSVELSKAYVEDKDIEFETYIKNSVVFKIDENRFMSCIVNIIKNAIESIEVRGKISVIGEVKNNCAVLKISNNGKPIQSDKQSRIFDCGYTSKQSGSGYGLYICKKYLNSQNADIELVKSNRSETTFKITISL